jgi:hypothetical protein
MKFITPESETNSTRKRKSRIEKQAGEAVGVSLLPGGASARFGTGRRGGDVVGRRRIADERGPGELTAALAWAVEQVAGGARTPGALGVAKLMFQLGGRPRGIAALVPLAQQWPGFVDRKLEPLNQDTGGAKGLVVTSLARNGWGKPGEVRRGRGEAIRPRVTESIRPRVTEVVRPRVTEVVWPRLSEAVRPGNFRVRLG